MRRYHNVSIIVNDLNHDKIQEKPKGTIQGIQGMFSKVGSCTHNTNCGKCSRAPGRSAEHVSEFPVKPKISYI